MKAISQLSGELKTAAAQIADAAGVLASIVAKGSERPFENVPDHAIIEIMDACEGRSVSMELVRAEANLQRAIEGLRLHRGVLERRHAQIVEAISSQSAN